MASGGCRQVRHALHFTIMAVMVKIAVLPTSALPALVKKHLIPHYYMLLIAQGGKHYIYLFIFNFQYDKRFDFHLILFLVSLPFTCFVRRNLVAKDHL